MYKQILSVIFTAMIVGLASGCSNSEQHAEVENIRANNAAQYKIKEQMMLNKVKTGRLPKNYKYLLEHILRNQLIDPDSMKLKFSVLNPEFQGLVCGQINAKNRFGGYTGAKDFIATFDSSEKLLWVRTINEPYPENDFDASVELAKQDLDAIRLRRFCGTI